MALDVQAAAATLLRAYRTGEPVEPLVTLFDGLDVDGAYAVQLAQVEQWIADGAVVRGHKVGLTSAAMRRQLGVDQPDFGHLTDPDVPHRDRGHRHLGVPPATSRAGDRVHPRRAADRSWRDRRGRGRRRRPGGARAGDHRLPGA
ncbi:hypothetical protein GC106_4450 [Kibdelosporangium sp. 4NS15]|uniref:2-keto-4-pentenoate hydratase n=1 Tax=Kibdelosporangium persicum TaxID=2698649 RepID=A0ABX2EW70_9PSEU|nr:hypothetical protein [Kibdelosporangium persicum]